MLTPIFPPIVNQYDTAFLHKDIKITYMGIIIWCVAGCFALYHQVPPFAWLCFIIAGVLFLVRWINYQRTKQRMNYILTTPFPPELWRNSELRQQHLTPYQKADIEMGLRDFFVIHALAPKKPLAMPSQMVDKLWHAFILDTHRYQRYCKKAFGKVFHHVPDYQFSDRGRNVEMFTWQMACRIQGIRPANPLTVPRLFAVDKLLAGTVVGSFLWDSYQTQMAMLYRQWHAQTFSSTSDASSLGDIGQAYDDSCNVGLTDSGDCHCGGSGSDSSGDGGGDSGGCGGGCGGGD